ncbi:hypothetical protein, partial [Rhizobium leguminosarum]|uniref:hypothetical protein n=1 Tax=Rhizobium leguminosarum TaxID=384 RepID=UPI003F9E6D32
MQKPFLTSDTAKAKASEYWPIAGEAELSIDGLSLMLPILKTARHNLMTPALAADLRVCFVAPYFA